MKTVLVLAGGPDAEREVSLSSAAAVAEALRASGRFAVEHRVIDRPTGEELRAMPGDAVWPVLHGPFGEGGPMQDLLAADGRPFVGCGPGAARLAMDKVASKFIASECGLHTSPAAVLNPRDPRPPLPLPLVVKPIFEGSTIGLFICRTADEWSRGHAAAIESGKPYMIEPFIKGRELTLGLVDAAETPGLHPLPVIEIVPADGLYDYEAKYTRDDTQYRVNPDLPAGLAKAMGEGVRRLARRMGVRHLCRADFILDDENRAWFLEINTMPGFTGHSLVPMAAASIGLGMPRLCAGIVDRALSSGG
jgi:D-alanine-D-alanine ligase